MNKLLEHSHLPTYSIPYLYISSLSGSNAVPLIDTFSWTCKLHTGLLIGLSDPVALDNCI